MVLKRILARDPQLDKRLRPHSGHRRMAHLNCPTVSKCLAVSPLGQRDRRDTRDTLVRLLRECLYHPLQYPGECCPFIKTFSYICGVIGLCPLDITYCESVFRRSLLENVEVFKTSRTIRNNTHFRIDTCGRLHSAYPYPISIRVWGIVSFISSQVFPQPSNR